MDNLKGQLLISGGGLYDPNFRHTVVLIGEHTQDGALGVVLNRVLDLTVQEALPPLGGLVPEGDHLYQGGPVQPDGAVLLAEFKDPNSADILVFDSVGFLVGDVPSDIGHTLLKARVFAGYSGWGPGQLESEMAGNSWITDPARLDDVFTDQPDLLWNHVLRRKGPEYDLLAQMPYDPSMN